MVKTCPECHQIADDELPFCTLCGALLDAVPKAKEAPQPTPHQVPSAPVPAAPPPLEPRQLISSREETRLPVPEARNRSWIPYTACFLLAAGVTFAVMSANSGPSKQIQASYSPSPTSEHEAQPLRLKDEKPPAFTAQTSPKESPSAAREPAKEEVPETKPPEAPTAEEPDLDAQIEAEIEKDPVLALAVIAEDIDFNQLCTNPEGARYVYDAFMNLRVSELDLLRNTICARHGYIFTKREYREHFSKQPWYRGVTKDTSVVDAAMGEQAVKNVKWFLTCAEAIRRETASDARLSEFPISSF